MQYRYLVPYMDEYNHVWQGVRLGDQGDIDRWQNWSSPKQISMHCPVPSMASDDFCKKNECKSCFPLRDTGQKWWHFHLLKKNCFSPDIRRYLTLKWSKIDKLEGQIYTTDSGESISDNLFFVSWTTCPYNARKEKFSSKKKELKLCAWMRLHMYTCVYVPVCNL